MAGCKQLKELPDTIGGLTKLRSLVLSGCIALITLPRTISSMNLLTNLDVQGCKELSELPSWIWELQSLKVLRLQGCFQLRNFLDPKECLQKMHVLGLPLRETCSVDANVNLHGRWWYLCCKGKPFQELVEDENKAILEHLPSDHYEYINAKVRFIEFHVLIPISFKECYNVNVTKSCRIQRIAPSY